MILRDVFAKTVADLKAHNIEGAERDARALLAHAIDLPADRLTKFCISSHYFVLFNMN